MNEKYLTAREVEARLRIARHTLYRLIKAGIVPAVRLGGQFRIPESALNEALSTGWRLRDERS